MEYLMGNRAFVLFFVLSPFAYKKCKGVFFMVSEKTVVLNQVGIHLRPAKNFCAEALKYQCQINICKENATYNAKSVISILSARIKYGDEIHIECDGVDEVLALKELVNMVNSRFGEKAI